ncbi:MAG: DHH family phosphoesterase [Candidatus Kerfeldbacteria bacterium]|nr:DHH family phosphoesterase [Candidatus Kerfeldbacteria bacterium]
MHSPIDQTIEQITKAKNVLIALARDPSLDAIASSLALSEVLGKEGKNVKVVAENVNVFPSEHLLPKSREIESDLTSLKKFVINLDVSQTPVEELSYDIKDKTLQIFITPKSGFFRERDVTFGSSDYAFDLIFVVDAPDLESLGKLYDTNAEFFYHTPVVNIDHSASNEHFGEINIVDLTATSTSEIIFDLIKKIDEHALDEYLATHLLAGIISKTKSFQTSTVTPKSLSIASHLISSGARRDDIVRHLYQTKSIPVLRLWGRVLARLHSDDQMKMVWSVLKKEDFDRAGTDTDALESVIDELIINTPESEFVMVLYEEGDGATGIVYTPAHINALEFFEPFEPKGSKDFTRIRVANMPIKDAEAKILEHVRSKTGKSGQ